MTVIESCYPFWLSSLEQTQAALQDIQNIGKVFHVAFSRRNAEMIFVQNCQLHKK
jgi:hypothetical protein